ncbi:salivary anticoagulant protein P23-like [Haemaphysalis longicornis]
MRFQEDGLKNKTMQCMIFLPLVFAWLGCVKAYGYGYSRSTFGESTSSFQRVRSNTVSDANDLIDAHLLPRMHNLVKATPGLYPWARLAPFRFTVASTGITNIDLKAHVVWAGFKNFATAVRRVGDCTPGEDIYRRVPRQADHVRSRTVHYGNTTITCTFAFDGIEAYLNVETRGDSLFNTLNTVEVEVSMYDTRARFEVTTAPDSTAHVRTFDLESVNFRVWPDEEELDLNTSRMESFKSFIAQKLREEFVRKVYGDYRRLLEHACSRINFSLAS